MLRITQQSSPAAAKSYYAASDYYREGQELVGSWGGKGAERLGLEGTVGKRAFDLLCEDRDPATGKRLTPRIKDGRTVGYDFTWSVPKSVSVLYALTRDESLLGAFRSAVDETMRDIEAEMKTRVRVKGANAERVTGNALWATFYHFTSRPVDGLPDPQMHAHCFVFNTTFDSTEGRWKAGQFRDLKRDAPYWQAAFRVRLANRLQELGYALDRTRDDFEVAGISPSVLTRFSRRTQQVEKAYHTELAERLVEAGYGILKDGLFELEGVRQSGTQIVALAQQHGLDLSAAARSELGGLTREHKDGTLTWPQLQWAWRHRLTDAEAAALARLARDRTRGRPVTGGEKDAATHALRHAFERASVVSDKELLAEALRHGLGRVTVEGVSRELTARPLIARDVDGRRLVTSREVLDEEKRVVAFARRGRGTCAPLVGYDMALSRDWLNRGQERAVRHLWESPDRVALIRGAAGTGKTTLLQEAVEGIEACGHRVTVLAPSAEASRGVLRREGFTAADTVARFLQDGGLQERARGGVILIDEASLLGARTLSQVFDRAERLDARVVLVGDARQHGSVERGQAFHLLQERAGVPVIEVTEIQRQRDRGYKDAVAALSEGRVLDGFDELDRLGWVEQLPDGVRDRRVAADYLRYSGERRANGESKEVLVVSPTHAEGQRITTAIRDQLRQAGRLGEERVLAAWAPANLTEAERGESFSYAAGDMLQFHKSAPGVRPGQRLVVGEGRALPLAHADRFQVYRPRALAVAVGDRLRVTANGRTKDGKYRLNNGAFVTVRGFTPEGDVVIDHGRVIGREFGHLAHGYVVTSHASQGRTVDRVLVAQSGESFPASSREQFYVSASRAREGVAVYTDDKQALRGAIGRGDPRMTATDLVRPRRRGIAERLKKHLAFRHRSATFASTHPLPEPHPLPAAPGRSEVSYERD